MPKLLVVDDSALMRKFFKDLFASEPDFELDFARTGREAIERLHSFEPDVLTLDVNMPEMDGLTALAHIMTERPTPVVMVSSLTTRDALATLEALALGAVDHVAKPGGSISLGMGDVGKSIKDKVRAASRSRVRMRVPSAARPVPVRARSTGPAPEPLRAGSAAATAETSRTARPSSATLRSATARAGVAAITRRAGAAADPAFEAGDPLGVVVIGVSTGGPRVLEEILPRLPADLPWPVVVIQHMPPLFTGPFAQRLDQHCTLRVVEACESMPLVRGNIYVAHGGADAVLVRRGGRICMVPKPEDPKQFWHPSVEVMMRSAMQLFTPRSLIGVMLTGMGYDGAEAMAELHRNGGRTVAESEESAVVFGMPGELVRRGGASKVASYDQIPRIITSWLGS